MRNNGLIAACLILLGVNSLAHADIDATGKTLIRGKQDIRGLERATIKKDGTQVVTAKLAGNGVIPAASARRLITGTVSPGNSPGCVTDQGNVVFEAGADLQIELGGTTPCVGYDQYTVNLSLKLNSGTLNVSLYNGFVPQAGSSFDILNWGMLTGTFGTLNLPELSSGLTWDTSALYTTGELKVVSAVINSADAPLPAWSIVLMSLCLLTALQRNFKV